MRTDNHSAAVTGRIAELLALYDNPGACAAHLLCDRHDPEKLAYRIIAPDLSRRDISYGELRRESERFAGALQSLGIGPGDRVATLMGKSRQYLVTLLAIWRLGAVHVPLFTAFAPPAIALRLLGSGAKLVVCDATQRPKLVPGDDIPSPAPWRVITTGPADADALSFDELMRAASPVDHAATVGGRAPMVHIYTSGTTGKPKGVVLPLRALAATHAYTEFGFDLQASDVFWCAADPGWAYGLYFGILSSLQTGVRSILLEGGFSPELTLRVLVFIPWLVREIVMANLQMARVVLSPRLRIQPHLIRVPASQRTPVGLAIHANTITITPGTISLDVRDGTILVHALTEAAASEDGSGDIDRKISWVEGRL